VYDNVTVHKHIRFLRKLHSFARQFLPLSPRSSCLRNFISNMLPSSERYGTFAKNHKMNKQFVQSGAHAEHNLTVNLTVRGSEGPKSQGTQLTGPQGPQPLSFCRDQLTCSALRRFVRGRVGRKKIILTAAAAMDSPVYKQVGARWPNKDNFADVRHRRPLPSKM
jgi:hypothetical protein